jgi:hypothetical protein
VEAPETRYVKTPDGAHIAYQVFGDGPFDLVYVPGFASNVEYMWREAKAASLRRTGNGECS